MEDFKSPCRRIVFCRLGGIGDVIHTLPLVKYLRKKYENASIEYITSKDISELLTNSCSFIDRVWAFSKIRKKRLSSEILREGKINYFFNFHNSLSFFFFNLFYLKANIFFQYKKNNSLHAVVNFAKTYDKTLSGFELDRVTLSVNCEKEFLDSYGLKENKYLCFVPGVGKERPHRGWPFEKWIDLTKKILDHEKEFKIVFLGGEDESSLFDNYKNLNGQIVNLISKLSLSEATKIISKSACLISCDTGLLHMASAIGVKVIGLYGPTKLERTGPFSANSQVAVAKNCKCISNFWDVKKCKLTKELTGYCMNNLSVDNVLALIEAGSSEIGIA